MQTVTYRTVKFVLAKSAQNVFTPVSSEIDNRIVMLTTDNQQVLDHYVSTSLEDINASLLSDFGVHLNDLVITAQCGSGTRLGELTSVVSNNPILPRLGNWGGQVGLAIDPEIGNTHYWFAVTRNYYIGAAEYTSGDFQASTSLSSHVYNKSLVKQNSAVSVLTSVYTKNASDQRYSVSIPIFLLNSEHQVIAGRILSLGYYGNSIYVIRNTNAWELTLANELLSAGLPWSTDPYAGGGYSDETGDERGTFDNDSDGVPDSSIPAISASATGFTRIYVPSLSQLNSLAQYLWTDDTLGETLWNKVKQFIENPMSAFIGLNLLPCDIPREEDPEEFKVMYIPTGVYLPRATNQFIDVDCGTLAIEKYYNSALDYSPYTKLKLFLPYIGTIDLDTDEVMGRTVRIKYRIDIVSGACVAKVLCDYNGDGTEDVLYQFSGHCAVTLPLTQASFDSYFSAMVDVSKVAIGAAAGVAGAAAGLAAAGSGSAASANQATSVNWGDALDAYSGLDMRKNVPHKEAKYGAMVGENLANSVGSVMMSKREVQHSGSFGGASGYLGVRRPFLIINRPRQCLPENYQTLNGYPCMVKHQLSECSGYTQVQQVQLTGIACTQPEQEEIQGLLKMGVLM